jgi:hypothetical protein
VREFSRSIAAAGAGPPARDMLTFKGLTLSSLGFIGQNPLELGCILQATEGCTWQGTVTAAG